MSAEERITELEIRIAHLEATLQTMSDELAAQLQRHRALGAELDVLRQRLAATTEPQTAEQEPPPPHY